jgi:excisionase family DNA binding protein
MTGKDLIIYILENNLENEPVFQHGKFIGFVTAGEVAEQLNVGVATIYVWVYQKRLEGILVGGSLYIPADYKLKEVD